MLVSQAPPRSGLSEAVKCHTLCERSRDVALFTMIFFLPGLDLLTLTRTWTRTFCACTHHRTDFKNGSHKDETEGRGRTTTLSVRFYALANQTFLWTAHAITQRKAQHPPRRNTRRGFPESSERRFVSYLF